MLIIPGDNSTKRKFFILIFFILPLLFLKIWKKCTFSHSERIFLNREIATSKLRKRSTMQAISSDSTHNTLLEKKYLKTDYESLLFDPKIIKQYCSLYDSFLSEKGEFF